MRVKGLSCLCGTEVECEALDLRVWGSIPGRGMSFMSLIMMGEDERVIEEKREEENNEEEAGGREIGDIEEEGACFRFCFYLGEHAQNNGHRERPE